MAGLAGLNGVAGAYLGRCANYVFKALLGN